MRWGHADSWMFRFGPYRPIYFVAHTPNLLDVHKPYAVVGGSEGSSYLEPI